MIEDTRLKQILAAVIGVPENTIDEDSSMDTIEKWDSLKHMNIVLALEEEYGVSIPDEDASNITSYKLIKLVLQELEQQK